MPTRTRAKRALTYLRPLEVLEKCADSPTYNAVSSSLLFHTIFDTAFRVLRVPVPRLYAVFARALQNLMMPTLTCRSIRDGQKLLYKPNVSRNEPLSRMQWLTYLFNTTHSLFSEFKGRIVTVRPHRTQPRRDYTHEDSSPHAVIHGHLSNHASV